MRNYTHKEIGEVLGVSSSTIYRWFPARRSGLIAENEVLAAINPCRRNGQPALRSLPEKLYSPTSMAEWHTANTPRPRTADLVRDWCDKGCPHFRLGGRILLDMGAVTKWLDEPRNPFRKPQLPQPA